MKARNKLAPETVSDVPTEAKREPTIREKIGVITTERKIPFRILLELTRRCNLSCKHCYIANRNAEELATAQLKNVLSQLAGEGCLELTLTGGELFLRSDWFDIAQFARKKHFALKILTNGTLITEEISEQLQSLHPLSVDVSIHGSNAETHDTITQVSGSFESSIRALRLCREKGMRTRIKCLLMKENVNEAEQIIKLANNLDAKYLFDPYVTPKINGDKKPLAYQVDDKKLITLYSKLQSGSFSFRPRTEKKDTKKIRKRKRTALKPCDAGISSGFISANGDVYPCVQLVIKLGNIKVNTFGYIWHHSQEAKEFRDLRIQKLPVCSECSIVHLCSRCPGLALLEDGDFLGPSSRACQTTKALASLNKESNVLIG